MNTKKYLEMEADSKASQYIQQLEDEDERQAKYYYDHKGE